MKTKRENECRSPFVFIAATDMPTNQNGFNRVEDMAIPCLLSLYN
ncbi:hypothetical protein bmyco0003_6860 [Bacillus pseudomycoides]|nr:hypothetical protein bmyco0002_6780 [Bacillus pseudomycoides]EEM12554.1 hypothetical protein bmyco0003_6860 [Bacillus pseudomycoides]